MCFVDEDCGREADQQAIRYGITMIIYEQPFYLDHIILLRA
jgi:hypothetical protein